MKKPTLYYFELDSGCGLYAAQNIRQAERQVKEWEGTKHFKFIRKASLHDLEWVQGMGGHVPEVFAQPRH